jgi:hypothetical protein
MNEQLAKKCANSHRMDKNMPVLVTESDLPAEKFLHSWQTDRLSAEIRLAELFRLDFG